LLDKGFNFVPCQHINQQSIFYNLIKQFDSQLIKFNRNLFFNKINKTTNTDSRNLAEPNIEIIHSPCVNYSCIQKRLKQNKPHQFPIQKESLEFRLQFIQELSKTKVKFKQNLTLIEKKALLFFTKNKPFIILEADKNIGACIISKELETTIALDSLKDTSTYLNLSYNPLSETTEFIKNKIDELIFTKLISEKLGNLLILGDPVISNFRILPKLHKDTFSIRPIINCINSPTSKICQFLDLVLQPFVRNTESYLQDSQHLLQIFDKLDVSSYTNLTQYSCDFSSLYTNINLILAMDLILKFINENNCLSKLDITIIGFTELILLVFSHNIFKFRNNFYKQITGIAMGSVCGPTIANIVVWMLEKNWLNIHRPLVYKRYIDDIYILSSFPINLVVFKSEFDELELNIVSGDKLNFLDLNIKYDETFGRMRTSLYIKPTQTFSYLSTDSNHKESIYRNIPISLFIRVKRICTTYSEFLYSSRRLLLQLCQRGYSFRYLLSILRTIGSKSRNTLLPYKDSTTKLTSTTNRNKMWLIMPFNKSNIDINKLLYNSFNNINYLFKLTNNGLKPISVGNSINPSLGSIFVHNRKSASNNYNYFSKPCILINCKICEFVHIRKYIKEQYPICIKLFAHQ